MTLPELNYYFKPGRKMMRGRTNPGLLTVDRVRSFQCNSISKDKLSFYYVCNERLTIGVKCKAKALVEMRDVEGEGTKPILVKVDIEHECSMNVPKAIGEEMETRDERNSS